MQQYYDTHDNLHFTDLFHPIFLLRRLARSISGKVIDWEYNKIVKRSFQSNILFPSIGAQWFPANPLDYTPLGTKEYFEISKLVEAADRGDLKAIRYFIEKKKINPNPNLWRFTCCFRTAITLYTPPTNSPIDVSYDITPSISIPGYQYVNIGILNSPISRATARGYADSVQYLYAHGASLDGIRIPPKPISKKPLKDHYYFSESSEFVDTTIVHDVDPSSVFDICMDLIRKHTPALGMHQNIFEALLPILDEPRRSAEQKKFDNFMLEQAKGYEQKLRLDGPISCPYEFLDEVCSQLEDIDTTDMAGNTFLHRAISMRDIKRVKALLRYGASIRIKNNSGHDALDHVKYLESQDQNLGKIRRCLIAHANASSSENHENVQRTAPQSNHKAQENLTGVSTNLALRLLRHDIATARAARQTTFFKLGRLV